MIVDKTTQINVGDTPINTVYQGEKEIWSSIPYTKLNYLESTGTQYIDSGVYMDSNTKFEGEYILTGTTQYASLLGVDQDIPIAGPQRLFLGLIYNFNVQQGFIYAGNRIIAPFNYSCGALNIKTKASYDGNKVVITNSNGTFEQNCVSDRVTLADSTAYVYCKHRTSDNAADLSKIKLYYLKIWDGSQLVRDFIPVLDESNVPCLYDKVSKSYFYNQGIGQFLYG